MKSAVKIIVTLCLLGGLIPATPPAHANTNPATVHVVLFFDTNDSRVGSSCTETKKFFESTFAPQLKDYTGATVKTHLFSGDGFELPNLNRTLANLNTSPNDAIFFYYAGHGYNRNQNPFPTMTLGRDGAEVTGRQMDLMEAYNTLRRKPHRLLVTIAEACNKPAVTRGDLQGGRLRGEYSSDTDDRNNFRKLFREATGDYIMSSSVKGEYSYLATGNPGFFTCAFRDAFREVTGKEYSGAVTWEAVLGRAMTKTVGYARDNGLVQNPQWQKGDGPLNSGTGGTPPSVQPPAPVSNTGGSGGFFTDSRDGKTYRTVRIDGKVWMAENLNYKTGNSWCYENASSDCDEYGRLYDWSTAMKVCPSGWHLPSGAEWDDLIQAAGGKERAGKKLKSKTGWGDDKHNGTDIYGFSALPGGIREIDGKFCCVSGHGNWWNATEYGSDSAYALNMYFGDSYNYNSGNRVSVYRIPKGKGLSVRCAQDVRP